MLAAVARQPTDLPPLAVLRNAVLETMALLTPEDRERELLRHRLVYTVPELRIALFDEMNRNVDLIADGLAERLGRSSDDFEVRVFAEAVTGAMHAVIGPDFDYKESVRALDFIERGMPFS
jgi:hypothetical protein